MQCLGPYRGAGAPGPSVFIVHSEVVAVLSSPGPHSSGRWQVRAPLYRIFRANAFSIRALAEEVDDSATGNIDRGLTVDFIVVRIDLAWPSFILGRGKKWAYEGPAERHEHTHEDCHCAILANNVDTINGISFELYSRIERGLTLPGVPTLVRIAAALHVTTNAPVGRAVLKVDQGRRGSRPEAPELVRLLARLRRAQLSTFRVMAALPVALQREQWGRG